MAILYSPTTLKSLLRQSICTNVIIMPLIVPLRRLAKAIAREERSIICTSKFHIEWRHYWGSFILILGEFYHLNNNIVWDYIRKRFVYDMSLLTFKDTNMFCLKGLVQLSCQSDCIICLEQKISLLRYHTSTLAYLHMSTLVFIYMHLANFQSCPVH